MSITNELTSEQKKGLLQGLKEKGLNTDNIMKNVVTTGNQNYLTDIPGLDSLIPVQKLAVHNLSNLKKFAGNSDEEYQTGKLIIHLHEDLPEWEQAKNNKKAEELSVEDNIIIFKALKTYVYGYSAKVKSYETVIHNHHFPLTLASYSAQNIIVKSGDTLTVSGTRMLGNFGTVTVEAGGRINFETNAAFNVQYFISGEIT